MVACFARNRLLNVCCFNHKFLPCTLILTIFAKHYFFGYIDDLKNTYAAYQSYHFSTISNDTFFEEAVLWTNEELFTDCANIVVKNISKSKLMKKRFSNNKRISAKRLTIRNRVQQRLCRPELTKSQFYPIAQNAKKVQPGGAWEPATCKHSNSVAIIVPFRWRESHLKHFVPYMHLFLQNQLLKYRLIVVEQNGVDTFNRGKLMNVGFVEATHLDAFDCFVFHDVDLFPLDENIFYNCTLDGPLHMAGGIDKFGNRLPYSVYFGGVTAFTEKQYRLVNGFSNNYYGWGGEDDALGFRVKLSGQRLIRLRSSVAKYKMIKHERDKGNEENLLQRLNLLDRTFEEWRVDGLNSLNYSLVKFETRPLCTRILVDI